MFQGRRAARASIAAARPTFVLLSWHMSRTGKRPLLGTGAQGVDGALLESGVSLLGAMLQCDPANRPTAVELLQHPFVQRAAVAEAKNSAMLMA